MDSKEIVGVGPLTEDYCPKPLILSIKILFGKKKSEFFLMKVVKNLR